MREYAKVSPLFWTGNTGRAIRRMGQTSQLAALYLITGPGANMLGVYHLPVVTLAHAIGSPFEGALEALRSLSEGGFCTYDEDAEWVWVHEMAAYQVGSELKAADNRTIAIQKEWLALPAMPVLAGFFERYGEAYHLKKRDDLEAPRKPLGSPFEAPSRKPLRSQEQEQEQEQEKRTLTSDQATEADSPPQSPPPETPPLTLETQDTTKPAAPPHRLNGKTAMVEEVIRYMNLMARRNYLAKNPNGTPTTNADFIAQRLKEGYTVDQLKLVIGIKADQWMGDEKMDQHLNPQTLFRKSNFARYLAEAEAAT